MNYIPNISNLNKRHVNYKKKIMDEKEQSYQEKSQNVIKEIEKKIPECIEAIENYYEKYGYFPNDITKLYSCRVHHSWELTLEENYNRFKEEVKNIYKDNVTFVKYNGGHENPELYVGIKLDYFKNKK